MLSIEHCRKKLEKYGKKYTDEEIREIREILYRFATCQLKDLKSGRYDKRNNLHKGINGRPSG